MSFSFADWFGLPGPQASNDTAENAFLWGPGTWQVYSQAIILDSTAVDSGSATTTQLRAGLLLGLITSSSTYAAYAASNTNGTEVVRGVLVYPLSMLNINGVAVQKLNVLLAAGAVKNSKLYGLDNMARSQMRGRFVFDDDLTNVNQYFPWRRENTQTANYTVLGTDAGTLFDNTGATGAVKFTLPTLASGNGRVFGFLAAAAQNITIASNETTNIIYDNNASGSSVALSTPGDIIGGLLVFYTNPAGTKWIMEKRCANALTLA
jgi:hypothetical protein